jgi:hypothetical protein
MLAVVQRSSGRLLNRVKEEILFPLRWCRNIVTECSARERSEWVGVNTGVVWESLGEQ